MMSKIPLKISREALLLLIFGVIGLGIFFWFFPRFSTTARLGLEINRYDAQRIARQYIEDQGFIIGRYPTCNTYFRIYNSQTAFYQAKQLSPSEEEQINRFSTVCGWHVIFRHAEINERFQVIISPYGEVFNYKHSIPPYMGQVNLSQPEALALAKQFLSQYQVIDWSEFVIYEAQTQKIESRTDHVFRWEHKTPGPAGIRFGIWATVIGDRVEGWNRHIKLPREFTEEFQNVTKADEFINITRFIVPWLIIVVALILFVRRYHTGEVSLRNALLFATATAGILTLNAMNVLSASELMKQAYNVDEMNFHLLIVYLNLAVQVFFIGLGTFFIWGNGESMTRELWGEKLHGIDAIFSGYFFGREQGKSILQGFALAGIHLALFISLTAFVVKNCQVWVLSDASDELLLSAFVPVSIPIAQGFFWALMGMSWTMLFTWPLLHRILKNIFVAGAITLVIFEISYSTLPLYSIWYRLGILLLAAIPIYLFYLRYDLLTVGVGLLVINTLYNTLLFFLQPNNSFQFSGWVNLVLLGGLLIHGCLAVWRGRELDETQITPTYVRLISEREQLKLELDIARKAQLRMLPQQIPTFPELDIAAYSEPAREVGGDYYDFVAYDSNRLGIVIGDVSGKGMPAALYMTLTKGFFLQAVSDLPANPRDILVRINRNFYRAAESTMFISLCYSVFDLPKKVMTYVRAGHTPMLYCQAAGLPPQLLQPSGLAIGLERGPLFEQRLELVTIPFQSGDIFIFYTDGLTEGMNHRLEEFGEARLMNLVQQASPNGAEKLLELIRKEYRKFIGRQEALDDLTCVVVKIL